MGLLWMCVCVCTQMTLQFLSYRQNDTNVLFYILFLFIGFVSLFLLLLIRFFSSTLKCVSLFVCVNFSLSLSFFRWLRNVSINRDSIDVQIFFIFNAFIIIQLGCGLCFEQFVAWNRIVELDRWRLNHYILHDDRFSSLCRCAFFTTDKKKHIKKTIRED